MDLSKLDLSAAAEKGATLKLRHPITDDELVQDKTGEPVTITVMGGDSKQFRQAADRLQRARSSGRNKQPSLKEAERFASQLLGAVTIGWSGVEWEGAPLECTPENAAMLYEKRPWVRQQVDEFVGDAGNFYRTSKSS